MSGAGRLGSLVALTAALLCSGCKSDIGVERVSPPRRSFEQVNASALNGNGLSASTLAVLHRHSLHKEFRSAPRRAIEKLQAITSQDSRRDPLLALAEMNFSAGEMFHRSVRNEISGQAREHYLACEAYDCWYLFLEKKRDRSPTAYDRQFRLACDLYNGALAPALALGAWEVCGLMSETVRS